MIRYAVSATVLALVLGCASARIYPKDDGSFLLVATSHSDSSAHDKALEAGNKHCHEKGQNFAIVDLKSSYNGASKDAKLVVGAVSQMMQGHNQYGQPLYGSPSQASHEDYKVELNFRCK